MTPLSAIERHATHFGDGLFGLELCPFGRIAQDYQGYYGEETAGFKELTGEFDVESSVAKEMKVGLGAGVGPFCIFHQPMRSQAGANITPAGKPVEVVQLPCKGGNGAKAFARQLIAEFGCNQERVEQITDSHTCCYEIRIKGC